MFHLVLWKRVGVCVLTQNNSDAAAAPAAHGSGGPGPAAGLCSGLLDQTEPPQLPQRCGVSVFVLHTRVSHIFSHQTT